jgi:myosin heavy subunit
MAKIDTSKIKGYEDMSAEDKIKALEELEYEDHAAEVERLRTANSKANSEAAEWKRKYNDQLSEEEKKKQEDADNLAKMQQELDELRRDKTVSEYKAKYIAQGYSEDLAAETAKALSEGDTAKVFANQQKFLEEYAKKIKADALKDTPKPPAGDGSDGMTLKKLKGLSDEEYNKFAVEHPDEYKALYEKGE